RRTRATRGGGGRATSRSRGARWRSSSPAAARRRRRRRRGEGGGRGRRRDEGGSGPPRPESWDVVARPGKGVNGIELEKSTPEDVLRVYGRDCMIAKEESGEVLGSTTPGKTKARSAGEPTAARAVRIQGRHRRQDRRRGPSGGDPYAGRREGRVRSR